MHFDILVEDQSGKILLEHLVPKIIGASHTYKIHAYHGIGSLPKGRKQAKGIKHSQLLNILPALIAGYGQTYRGYGRSYKAALVVVCDLDDKCMKEFRRELDYVVKKCVSAPGETRFCFAVEEGEAWLLGDKAAVREAYPHAKNNVLNTYQNDSICDTWELLADAVYDGGRQRLSSCAWSVIGTEKCSWAEKIGQYMNVNNNKSPSFNYFRKTMKKLAGDENA